METAFGSLDRLRNLDLVLHKICTRFPKYKIPAQNFVKLRKNQFLSFSNLRGKYFVFKMREKVHAYLIILAVRRSARIFVKQTNNGLYILGIKSLFPKTFCLLNFQLNHSNRSVGISLHKHVFKTARNDL